MSKSCQNKNSPVIATTIPISQPLSSAVTLTKKLERLQLDAEKQDRRCKDGQHDHHNANGQGQADPQRQHGGRQQWKHGCCGDDERVPVENAQVIQEKPQEQRDQRDARHGHREIRGLLDARALARDHRREERSDRNGCEHQNHNRPRPANRQYAPRKYSASAVTPAKYAKPSPFQAIP